MQTRERSIDDMKYDTVKTDAFTMDYCRFGRGRDTLVILPGVSTQRVLTAGLAIAKAYAPLAEDYTIYLFERRNDMPPGYSVREMARDTARAIQALGLGPVNLFGASQGGMMAMVIAIEYPALVGRLVLGSTSARISTARYQMFDRWIQLAKDGNAAELALAFGQALYPPEVFEQSRSLLVESARATTAEGLERFIIMAQAVKDFDILNDLGRIACPTLVIGSRADRVVGGDASVEIAGRIGNQPDCELFMYDGYGHAAYDLAPDYKARMLRFLTA